MIRKKLMLLIMSLMVTTAFAQRVTVSGRVTETDGKTPIEQATVQILSLPDSTYINGCVTNPKGNFTLPAVRPGQYAIKFSFVGYMSKVQSVNLTRNKTQVNLGTVTLADDAVMLKEAVVVAQAAQVEVIADTIQYNASAYRVPEGSALEELVKKIPGAEVSEDGKITLNGKDITKILVNGKEFFSDDPNVAMKNLTVDMVDKIKAYDKKSDQARVTGIDDGEEEAVLDLTMKKGQNQGVFANVTGGLGTKDRWMGQANVNRFSDHNQFSVMANLNNTNDMGFPGGGGGFRMGGNNGLTTRKMVGANFAMETKKLEMGGNIRFNYTKNDVQSIGSSINNQMENYSNNRSARLSKSQSINFDYRLEWKPTTSDNLIFRPRASYSKNDNTNNSYSTSSKVNPEDEPSLLAEIKEFLNGSGISVLQALPEQQRLNLINAQMSQSLSNSKNTNVSGELQYNHKFGDSGRNLTFRLTAGYTDGSSESFSNTDQWLFQYGDSASHVRRYTDTPSKNYNYSGRLTYSEPIAKGVYLQLSYQYTHRFSKNDQNTYDWRNQLDLLDNPIGFLPSNYLSFRDPSQSKYVENNFNDHNVGLTLRVNQPKWQLNAGAMWRPQHTQTYYQQGAEMTHLESFSHNYYNLAPTIDYRYNFSKQTRLRVQWRSNASQPSVSNMIPIINNSNPLNVSGGNPELEPSYSNNISAMFNTFIPSSQTSIMTNINYRSTSNSVSNMTVNNKMTGGTVSMPKNIDGNWNAMGMFVFNTAFKDKRFTVGSFSNVSFNNMASYFSNASSSEEAQSMIRVDNFQHFLEDFRNLKAEKNITKNTSLSERLNFAFRTDLFDVGINGSIQYSNVTNKLQPKSNARTYNYSYGINGNLNLPWSMSISTDLTNSSRRGYNDASYNTNELLWNVQVSQRFLKGKAATLTLQIYDILRQQTNFSRSVIGTGWSDTEYNAINSYAMLKFSYRLNLLGSKDMRDRMRGRMGGPGGFGGPGGPGGPGGGRGFGGGRP